MKLPTLNFRGLIKMPWFNQVPDQIRRLGFLAVVLIIVFLFVRPMLIPEGFGEYGHFRSGALDLAVSQPEHYAGKRACNECHEDMPAMLMEGYHSGLSCEVCHGPLAGHVEEPDEVTPEFPRGRSLCPVCHEYLSARPTGFPQIVSQSHNPLKPCISCHEPHQPAPPETPQSCSACHGAIARSKAVSHHANVDCEICHSVPEEHKIAPRTVRPTKPMDREFCGKCHDTGATTEFDAPKIDLATHDPRYVCWQCHYPHLPEA